MESLAAGTWPSRPCPGLVWDLDRDALGGKALLLIACVLHIKCDWKEAAETFGFPSWGSLLWPCLWCFAERSTLFVRGASSTLPFKLVDMDDYERAVVSCEVPVQVRTWQHLLQIRACLVPSGRSKSGAGLFLRHNIPHLGLQRGDRIEPSEALPDYAVMYDLTDLPTDGIIINFWRRSSESRVRRRNPIFSDDLGVEPQIMLGDVLHVLFLGVFQEYGAAAFQALLQANYWRAPARFGPQGLLEHTLTHFKTELKAWYPTWEARHPGQTLTRIQDIIVKWCALAQTNQPSTLRHPRRRGLCFFLKIS